jgi:hypothetical protein
MSQTTLDARVKSRLKRMAPVFTLVAANVVFQFGGGGRRP